MKKLNSLYLVLVILTLIGCSVGTKDGGTDIPIQTVFSELDSTKLFISISDMAVEKLIRTASPGTCADVIDNLQALRALDNQLALALGSGDSIGHYLMTRKVNPCCPCVSGGCCSCPKLLYFVGASNMNANMSIVDTNGSETSLQKVTTDGVDRFRIPQNVTGNFSLKLVSPTLDQPLNFPTEITAGTIDFNYN